jgi:hypothetical protein
MALKNYLISLSKMHEDGDVFLKDSAGRVYTVRNLLASLSPEQLSTDIDLESSGSESFILKTTISAFGKEKTEKWFSVHGNKTRSGWAMRQYNQTEVKAHFFKFDTQLSEFTSLCGKIILPNDHFTVFTKDAFPESDRCQLCLKKISSPKTASIEKSSQIDIGIKFKEPERRKTPVGAVFFVVALAAGLFYSCSFFNGYHPKPLSKPVPSVVYEPRDPVPAVSSAEPRNSADENKSKVIHEASGKGWNVKVEYEK